MSLHYMTTWNGTIEGTKVYFTTDPKPIPYDVPTRTGTVTKCLPGNDGTKGVAGNTKITDFGPGVGSNVFNLYCDWIESTCLSGLRTLYDMMATYLIYSPNNGTTRYKVCFEPNQPFDAKPTSVGNTNGWSLNITIRVLGSL